MKQKLELLRAEASDLQDKLKINSQEQTKLMIAIYKEESKLAIFSVIARLFLVIWLICWACLLGFALISCTWLIYWIVTGRNIMIDFKHASDGVRDWLNVA
jgi:hypothetical protein